MKVQNHVYDIECYKNFFSLTTIRMSETNMKVVDKYLQAKINKDSLAVTTALTKLEHNVFVVGHDRNDAFALRDFIASGVVLIGFNNIAYDDIVLMQLLRNISMDVVPLNALLHDTSQELISTSFLGKDHELYPLMMNKNFISIDLKKLYHLQKGLKMVAIGMKYPFIQDLPINPFDKVAIYEVEEMLSYNLNDVIMTAFMLRNKKEELQSRLDSIKMYSLNQSKTLSSSRPELAKLVIAEYILKLNSGDKGFLFKKTFRRYIAFRDIILTKLKL